MSGERLFPDRPLSDAVADADEVVERAIREHKPTKTFLLLSGGNDSMVLLWQMLARDKPLVDAIVHINTGIGVPETREFVYGVVRQFGVPFLEYHPPIPYEALVFGRWNGFPGPGFHPTVFQRLKERCVEELLRQHRTRRGERFLLLSGVRKAESRKRMGYKLDVQRKGGQVWANPLFRWANDEMRDFRERFNTPQSEVAANLHMSGECLCGAMANDEAQNREEFAALEFFYPHVARRIKDMEMEARRRGCKYARWGADRPDAPPKEFVGQQSFMPLCAGCDGRAERYEASTT